MNNNNILSISIASLFSLTKTGTAKERLYSSKELESVIENVLSPEVFWDTGVPKASGEFLVSASAYSAKPVNSLAVSVRVGDISKLLLVFGDRIWTEHGISEPYPFNIMPLKYDYAFGGPGYELNPVGKGFTPKIGVDTQLPNIESPYALIAKQSDTPEVVGFEPYPQNWIQRKLPSAIDFKQETIALSSETTLEHFNTAAVDQRLNGFFRGDEKIEIKNMHPLLATINSSLPGVRLRVFAVQQNTQGEDNFLEMAIQTDTLWLLPNLESGILLHRATCLVANAEASDIKCVYTIMEELSEEPKPTEYYLQNLLSNIQRNEILKTDVTNLDVPVQAQLKKEDQGQLDGVKLGAKNQVKQELGRIDEEKAIFIALEAAKKVTTGELPELDGTYKELLTKLYTTLHQSKLDEENVKEFMEARKKEGRLPYLSEDEIIELFKDVWIKDPELEKSLKTNMEKMKELRLRLSEKLLHKTEQNL